MIQCGDASRCIKVNTLGRNRAQHHFTNGPHGLRASFSYSWCDYRRCCRRQLSSSNLLVHQRVDASHTVSFYQHQLYTTTSAAVSWLSASTNLRIAKPQSQFSEAKSHVPATKYDVPRVIAKVPCIASFREERKKTVTCLPGSRPVVS